MILISFESSHNNSTMANVLAVSVDYILFFSRVYLRKTLTNERILSTSLQRGSYPRHCISPFKFVFRVKNKCVCSLMEFQN